MGLGARHMAQFLNSTVILNVISCVEVYIRYGFDPRTDSATGAMQVGATSGAESSEVIDFRDKFLKEQRAYFERLQGQRAQGQEASHFKSMKDFLC